MNEQPQQDNDSQDGQDQFYKPTQPQASRYAGYELNQTSQPQQAQISEDPYTLSWDASEYVHHSKGPLWLVTFVIIMLVFIVVAVWSQAWTFTVLIVIMAVTLGIAAFRPPHIVHYTLGEQGLQIDNKFYSLQDFRAFGIVHDGALYSVTLLPVKRLMPSVNIYFEEKDGEKIVDILGLFLPMEHIEPDPIDRLMHRLRF